MLPLCIFNNKILFWGIKDRIYSYYTYFIYVLVSCDRLSEEIRQVFSNVKNQPKHKDFHSKSF